VSAPPVLGSVAQDLVDGLEAVCALDEQNGYAGALLLAAVASMWQDIDDLIRDTDVAPGWARIVDVDLAPPMAFGWLAQIAGVKLTAGAPEEAQREEIRRVDGQRRGLRSTILSKVAPYITGSTPPLLLERTNPDVPGDRAYHITLSLVAQQLPGGLSDANGLALQAAFRDALPAGLIGHVLLKEHNNYDEVNAANASYNAAKALYADYIDMRDI
jgi:hypothetical protein